VCRALTVLCVAPDRQALADLKRAAVAADWELAPGTTDERDAMAQLAAVRPQVLVVFGASEQLVSDARSAYPSLRIVADRALPGATVVVTSLREVRGAIQGLPRPGGPVR
jgi:hypothetical protein